MEVTRKKNERVDENLLELLNKRDNAMLNKFTNFLDERLKIVMKDRRQRRGRNRL